MSSKKNLSKDERKIREVMASLDGSLRTCYLRTLDNRFSECNELSDALFEIINLKNLDPAAKIYLGSLVRPCVKHLENFTKLTGRDKNYRRIR